MKINIEIKNLPQIRAAFAQAPRLMNSEFKKALTKSAILVQRESMIRTPVKTGYLRASHTFDVGGGVGLGMRAEIYPQAKYGLFVHEGTRFMRSRPFLREGADASVNKIEGYFKDATQKALDNIARKV